MPGNSSSDIWLAAAFAAFCVDILIYPIDTLKTRIQSPDYRTRYAPTITTAEGTVHNRALFRGLYQGVASVISATLPASGAFFAVYETAKPIYAPYFPTPLAHALASATAEAVACGILTPAEVVKQNAQVASGSDGDAPTKRIARQFLKRPASLWSGYGALAARNIPFTSLQFPVYERLKHVFAEANARRRGQRTGELPLLEHGLASSAAAGCSGAFAAVLTTPVDVVKTRIMLAAAYGAETEDVLRKVGGAVIHGHVGEAVGVVKEEVKGVVSGAPRHRASGLSIARDIVREDGWRGLWKGGMLRTAWIVLGSGLYLGMYETGRVWLERRGVKVDEDI